MPVQRTTTFDRVAWLAKARERNRALIDAINARTTCAHCGAQPIEWHNPEHVELNRRHFRISSLVVGGSSIAAIEDELDRCTPLCRRCHMAEDGRLHALVERVTQPRQVAPSKSCDQCGELYKPLSRGLCKPCYRRQPDQMEHDRQYAANRRARARAGGIELPGFGDDATTHQARPAADTAGREAPESNVQEMHVAPSDSKETAS